jgi:hypothetical protein
MLKLMIEWLKAELHHGSKRSPHLVLSSCQSSSSVFFMIMVCKLNYVH